MALDPTTCAADIWSGYQTAAGLAADGQPSGEPADPGAFPGAFADAYDAYARAGEVPGATTGSEDPGVLEDALAGMSDSGGGNIDTLAQAFADYWATVLMVPGEPAHGGALVTDVTNDAASQAAAFKTAIESSLTSEPSTPYFQAFVENIESTGVAAITWTITEQFSDGSTQTFTETVS